MATTMRSCGCEIDMETGKQVRTCLTCDSHKLEMEVVRAAWELVLRKGSDTIRWGSFEKRLRALEKALHATGKPEDYGVDSSGPNYDWHGIL